MVSLIALIARNPSVTLYDVQIETYEGTHTSRIKERFAAKVLPFFSTNLAGKDGKAK
jgi:hypothetical protein